jgi:hypothetical protein
MMQHSLRARGRPIITTFGYHIWKKLELTVQPMDKTPNVICDLEFLGFGTEAF